MKISRGILLCLICLMAVSCAKDIVDLTGDIQGVVKDASSGQMIENCQVSLTPSGKSVITSSSGSFEFKDLEPGDYTLTFNRSGYNVDSKLVTVIAGDVVKADMSLKAKSPFALSEEYYDFGDLESSKTFYVYNNSGSDCSYSFGTVPQWLVLSKKSGSVDAGSNDSFTVSIDRSKVNIGEYRHNLVIEYNGQTSGSVILEVHMMKVEYSAPEVTTAGAATEISKNSFKIEGSIVKTGGAQITAFGHCWSTTSGATVDGNHTNLGMTDKKEVFVSTIEGLQVNTEYYVRAYATNQYGTSYGDEIKVRTQDQECDIWDGNIAQSFAGGSGTAGNPYLIETGGQLMLMKQYSDKNFKLMNNIDLNNNNWMPFDFSGTFDGNGFTIYNLRIHRDHEYNGIGFFSQMDGATVKNVKIDGVDIIAQNSMYVGTIAGHANKASSIINTEVIINKSLSALDCVGGLVGISSLSTSIKIENCKVLSRDNALIEGHDYVGGIIGRIYSTPISAFKNNHVSIDIVANSYVAGCVGEYSGSTYDSKIQYCSYFGKIIGKDRLAGICADGPNLTVESCKSKVYIEGEEGTGISYRTTIIACYSDGYIELKNPGDKADVLRGNHCYSTILTNGHINISANESVYIADSDDIARDMKEMYSEYASYWDYSNTWTWTGEVNGVTKSVKCPKLKWK